MSSTLSLLLVAASCARPATALLARPPPPATAAAGGRSARVRCCSAAAPEEPLTHALTRLDKLLAERGAAGSRKEVERLLRAGAVELDGVVQRKGEGKRKVRWGCAPVVHGERFAPPPLLAAYHKPVGIV